jgi:hypothetical protein
VGEKLVFLRGKRRDRRQYGLPKVVAKCLLYLGLRRPQHVQAIGLTRPLQMPLGRFLLPEAVAKCLLGPEATSACAGNGPDKTSSNAK